MNHLTASAADAVALTAERRPTPRRRALVVSPTPTWPLTAGNRVRAWQTAQALRRRGYEIHLVYFDQELRIGAAQYRAMAAQWDSLHVVPYRADLRRNIQPSETWRADDWFQDDLGGLIGR